MEKEHTAIMLKQEPDTLVFFTKQKVKEYNDNGIYNLYVGFSPYYKWIIVFIQKKNDNRIQAYGLHFFFLLATYHIPFPFMQAFHPPSSSLVQSWEANISQ